jgi:hypothetical protein
MARGTRSWPAKFSMRSATWTHGSMTTSVTRHQRTGPRRAFGTTAGPRQDFSKAFAFVTRARRPLFIGCFAGEPGRDRTCDPVIKSHVLYRLSYGLEAKWLDSACSYAGARPFAMIVRASPRHPERQSEYKSVANGDLWPRSQSSPAECDKGCGRAALACVPPALSGSSRAGWEP